MLAQTPHHHDPAPNCRRPVYRVHDRSLLCGKNWKIPFVLKFRRFGEQSRILHRDRVSQIARTVFGSTSDRSSPSQSLPTPGNLLRIAEVLSGAEIGFALDDVGRNPLSLRSLLAFAITLDLLLARAPLCALATTLVRPLSPDALRCVSLCHFGRDGALILAVV